MPSRAKSESRSSQGREGPPIPATEKIQEGRITVDGKFFRLDGEKFYPKGLAYGPGAPDEHGQAFAAPGRRRGSLRKAARRGQPSSDSIMCPRDGAWTWPRSTA